MNIQLVESLVNAIQALSPEERALLNEKLTQPSNWQSLRAKIRVLATFGDPYRWRSHPFRDR